MRRLTATSFVAAIILTACVAPPVPVPPDGPLVACTAIGCESQITFELDADLARGESYELEACVDGACTSGRLAVPESGFGAAGAFTVDADANTVTVRLLGDDYSGAHEVSLSVVDTAARDIVRVADTIEFDRLQPNGPGCEPVCWQATVRA